MPTKSMMVKWFLLSLLCLIGLPSVVRGDAADDLYNQGVSALSAEQYEDAGKAFDSVISGYPNYRNIDQAIVAAGQAYFRAGKYADAVDRLSKETTAMTKPYFQAQALYLTGLAQFSQGQKTKSKDDLGKAISTFTILLNLINTAPTPENKNLLEQAILYRALSAYLSENYDAAEKDFVQLTQQFSGSLSLPDYWLYLGNLYLVQTNLAITAKKTPEVIRATADKALSAFDRVSSDPNALVQANEANMSKGEVLFLIAQLDQTPASYQKALETFRLVHRKADMVPLQADRLEQLKKKSQALLQSSDAASVNATSDLINRETSKLEALKNGDDPIIQALLRMAECCVSMKQPDEARTILHRLVAHAKLTTEQQQEVDFQTLYSYVLGGQTDQADKALTDYLANHASDPQADSISLQIAAKLVERKDYEGAMHHVERSLKDFPPGKGRYVADVLTLKAQILTRQGKIKESNAVVEDFLKQNPTSPQANSLLLSRAQNETSEKNYTDALADYQKVKDNTAASADLQSSAYAGYIQTLLALKKLDDVVTESKAFVTKYPTSKALPSVMLLSALALDQKHDPGAVAALQDVAKKYPASEVAPYALSAVVASYQQAKNVPAMIQAANDLQKAYPESYALLAQAADSVYTVLLEQKKFDDAIALYQPLTEAKNADVAAKAQNKIGSIWLDAAKSLGPYQSMPLDMRAEAEKRLASAEQAYLTTLKKWPEQLAAVGDAFDGTVTLVKQRRSWGLLKEADFEGYLTKWGSDLTSPQMQARLELTKAELVFAYKNGLKQYPAALDRFKKVISASPNLTLTRQEAAHFGDLLLAAGDYATAQKVYTDLLTNAAPTDDLAHGDANYGLGATYLAQGDLAQVKVYFGQAKKLFSDGRWPSANHINDVNYGLALADEQSTQPADLDEARQIYAQLMNSPQAGVVLQAKAMLGAGRLLEKSGNTIKPTPAGPNEYAIHYYQEPHIIFGIAVPEISAEGLFMAGQAYEKLGDKVNAKKQYDDLITNYATTEPDWAAKAQAAEAKPGN